MRRIHRARVHPAASRWRLPPWRSRRQTPAPVHPDGWWGGFGGGISAIRFACTGLRRGPARLRVAGHRGGLRQVDRQQGRVRRRVQRGLSVAGDRHAGGGLVARRHGPVVPVAVAVLPEVLARALARPRDAGHRTGRRCPSSGTAPGSRSGPATTSASAGRVALTPYAGWYMSAIGDIGDPNGTTRRATSPGTRGRSASG